MPSTEGDIVSFVRGFKSFPYSFIMEEVGGYIGKAQPGSAMFKFGRNTGFLTGVIMALGFRLDLVRPQKWQKALSLGSSRECPSKTVWKNKLKAVAQRKFPDLDVTLATADALLILDYAETSA